MNARVLSLCFFLAAPAALAQGFAGMGAEAEGFTLPAPHPTFTFPEDHGAHPDFRIEWWYLTANLKGDDGRPYGVQWTLFRNALAPEQKGEERTGWQSPQVWMAHAGVTTESAHYAAERFARGGIGQAGVRAEPFDAWIDDWRMWGPTLNDVTLRASGDDFAYELRAFADRPFVLQGEGGFSVKSEAGQASYYYSQPFYEVTGTIELPSREVEVTGIAWLDREWSSQPLAEDQTGWDWFSLTFDNGDKLMAYRLRHEDGRAYTVGTWIDANGTATHLPEGTISGEAIGWSDVGARRIPTSWRLDNPGRGLTLRIEAVNPQSFMDVSVPYWEGPVTVSGSHSGVGYLEMTGYD